MNSSLTLSLRLWKLYTTYLDSQEDHDSHIKNAYGEKCQISDPSSSVRTDRKSEREGIDRNVPLSIILNTVRNYHWFTWAKKHPQLPCDTQVS
jgi:hypothetical protein